MAEVERITVSCTPGERELIEKLGNYFEKAQEGFDNNLSDTVQMCIRFTADSAIKAIEEER